MQVSPPGTWAGPIDCLLRTVRLEGPRAVYKGASPPAIGWAVSDSMLMGSLNTCACLSLVIQTITDGGQIDWHWPSSRAV